MYSAKSGCNRTKVVVFVKKLLYSGKVVVFRQSSYIWARVAAFEQKWLYLDKSGCYRSKIVVLEQK